MNDTTTLPNIGTEAWETPTADSPVFISQPMQFVTRVARLIAMQKGQQISERRAWSDVEITLLKGKCRIEFADHDVELNAHQPYRIEANLPHQLHALLDLRAVISFNADTSDASSLTA